MVLYLPGLFLHTLDGQGKYKKLIKNKAPPGSKHLFPILWEMNLAQGKIIFCQLIFAPYRIRQKLPGKIHPIQGLADKAGSAACCSPLQLKGRPAAWN